MKLQEMGPGFNTPNVNSQVNIPKNIKLVADKTELKLCEGVDVKAYITDENDNPVPNVQVSWGTSDKSDIGTVITDINGIAKKRILKSKSTDIVVTAKYNDLSSSIILKKERKRF